MSEEPTYHPPGKPVVAVEVNLGTAPDGRPAIIVQFPDGYIILPRPEQVEALAAILHEGAADLRRAIAGLS